MKKNKVLRKNGNTFIYLFDNFVFKTNLINRYKYNYLRKKDFVTPSDVLRAVFGSAKNDLGGKR
jgi:hypothetical protein